MNRKGPWEGNARYLLPVFLFAHIFIERERRLGTRQFLGLLSWRQGEVLENELRNVEATLVGLEVKA